MTRLTESELKIRHIDIWPFDIKLIDDFVISQGKVSTAENLFVKVRLGCGAVGYGEIAPFKDLTGEDRTASHTAANELCKLLINESVGAFRKLSTDMYKAAPDQPAARCGLETAVLDALCRAAGIPLWAFLGGASLKPLETDITIPILDLDRSLELADHWFNRGFRTFKVKVCSDIEKNVTKIREIAHMFPDASFVLDANQGFTEAEALVFINEVKKLDCKVLLFEQPVAKDNLAGMAMIKKTAGIPIAADESVASAKEALEIIQAKAADVINLKIMKSGVIEALDIASIARGAGINLMIGGMVETRIAMGCSLAIALGVGGIEVLDLDTPLLLSEDPVEGGYQYDGPMMTAWSEPGLGMRPKSY